VLDEAPFLRSILAAPEDDGPRHVFADWLSARGDPRGEFINLQCDLARRSPDERPEHLLARERELQRDHAQALAGAWYHPDIALHYERGLPVRLGHAGYFSSVQDDHRVVQRFFLDGRVISVSTTLAVRPEQLAAWFVHDYEDHGEYTLSAAPDGGLALRYGSTSISGTVIYEGVLHGAHLHVRWHSFINDRRAELDLQLWGQAAVDSRSAPG
jgi:uncharacterized protein (TIGR02996 family)